MGLRLAGVGPGSEVVTTPLSWVATGNVVLQLGARPVFVDVEPATRNIDLGLAETAVTARTKAIVPVDLAGLPVDRDRLGALAARHGLRVIEDAAQSMGARWKGREIGASGDLVAISFHANKNMTTSEGGCLVMNDEEEARLFEKLRLQGVTRLPGGEMEVDVLGGKSNLTDVAAAIGLGQMPHHRCRHRAPAQAGAPHYFATFGPDFESTTGAQLPLAAFEHVELAPVPDHRCPTMDAATRADFIDAPCRSEFNIGVGVITIAADPPVHAVPRTGVQGRAMFPHRRDASAACTVTLPMFYPEMDHAGDVERVCAARGPALEAAC